MKKPNIFELLRNSKVIEITTNKSSGSTTSQSTVKPIKLGMHPAGDIEPEMISEYSEKMQEDMEEVALANA